MLLSPYVWEYLPHRWPAGMESSRSVKTTCRYALPGSHVRVTLGLTNELMVGGDKLTCGDLGELRIRYAASAQKTLIRDSFLGLTGATAMRLLDICAPIKTKMMGVDKTFEKVKTRK